MVRHVNRSAYDLEFPSAASGTKLVASRQLKEAKQVTITELELNKQIIGKTFKAKQKILIEYLENCQDTEKIKLQETLSTQTDCDIIVGDDSFKLTKEMIKGINNKIKMAVIENYTPYVIELALGMGRIISAILEHNFKARDEQRTYLKLPTKIAPYKVSLLPLISNEESKVYVQKLSNLLYYKKKFQNKVW